MNTIPQPPTTFDVPPFCDRWIRWSEVNACFWPGKGRRSEKVDPILAPIRSRGGIYIFAWSVSAPKTLAPVTKEVQYIGQTNWFKRRMGQFGTSAGFWGKRAAGHGPGWHWPKGRNDKLWVAFFDVGSDLDQSHLAEGLRYWIEAVALEEHRKALGVLPPLQQASAERRQLVLK